MSGADHSTDVRPHEDNDVGKDFFPDQQRLQAALGAAGVGVWSWDLASDRVDWSSNLEAIHHLPPGSFDGTLQFVLQEAHPDERAQVLAAIESVRANGRTRRILYRLTPRPGVEELWMESIVSAATVDGRIVALYGTCRNVSERVHLHRELQRRAVQQEAVTKLADRALTEIDLQILFDEIATTVAQTLQVEFVKILELTPGDNEMLLRAGVGWRPGLVGSCHVSTYKGSQGGYTIALGGPVIVEDLATETRFESPSLLHEHRVVSGLSCPIAGRDGRAYGVIGAHTAQPRRFASTDVSFLMAVANVMAGAIQRRQLDQRQEILIRELRHRSGNLFSQLLALFSQTAKTSRSIAELTSKYEARVLAMANAHRLVTEGGWKSASLLELLNVLMAPYMDRVTLAGPNVFLEADPTFALGIAMHELATNASRHGSLSVPDGRIALNWRVERTERGLTLLMDWRERDGPPAKRPRRAGLGSRLMTMVIERQLNGSVLFTYGPQGLDVALTIPLTHERWPGTRAATEPHMVVTG